MMAAKLYRCINAMIACLSVKELNEGMYMVNNQGTRTRNQDLNIKLQTFQHLF
jgi:hypothetical protein